MGVYKSKTNPDHKTQQLSNSATQQLGNSNLTQQKCRLKTYITP
jgi:hypothetical protein